MKEHKPQFSRVKVNLKRKRILFSLALLEKISGSATIVTHYGTKFWAVKKHHIYKMRVVEVGIYGKIGFEMKKFI